MIVVITTCEYFKKGFGYIVDDIRREYCSFTEVVYAKHIGCVNKQTLQRAKAIIVDYGQADIHLLSSLFEFKTRHPDSYIILITRDTCYESTIDNILINALSDFSVDCKDALKKISGFLGNYGEAKHNRVITKNSNLYCLEKQVNLSKKEVNVLPFIMTGKKNKEISRQLDLSEKTICHYRRSIYKKFQVNNLAGLYYKIEDKR
ncbi:TPA_asm: helix-turn-helix transcriptional regulator [Salmonella enterica subsp. salamae serovar 60:g,m,t:z6]|uniref:Helix-turn-helix transcriptional regulator n=1 Tax=Salmonella enterica subsp. houtenae serovar 1,40:z4,z32:- TaxID=1967604 RepID=A0A730WIS3_SALHO|nr:LuxR C-terminal-related transcriptional regulator [Salmonella enterica]HAC6697637.1 helix-turn-helix transcriptional regulator [Salmonella bongori serovar 66:z65:-]HAE2266117.1 helix-turn-helix transcriptional regulator [Salmonella enterica subsp. enterica serovar 1,9,12:-:-]HAE4188203.1 helix-turn-helix transcriptional regulator [Salmonella enterica subsp. houtenae serovar 1,40:z4,z32:-]HAE7512735.1 helix-turn-helix transcriptional regulator [Salmonella enterica subsp. salamae serovar 60:g,